MRSAFAAYERGDLLATLDWAHPGIEFVLVGSTWKGLAQVESFVRDYMSPWGGFRIHADEYRELDGEHVLVLTHAGGRSPSASVNTVPFIQGSPEGTTSPTSGTKATSSPPPAL